MMASSSYKPALVLFVLLASLAWSSHAARIVNRSDTSSSARVSSLFSSWMKKYKMVFTGAEKAKRLKVFASNWAFVKRHQALNRSYTVGLNQFAHLSFDEFKARYLTYRPPVRSAVTASVNASRPIVNGMWRSIAAKAAAMFFRTQSLDWRINGAVTPVKNQGGCGEFIATAASYCGWCPNSLLGCADVVTRVPLPFFKGR